MQTLSVQIMESFLCVGQCGCRSWAPAYPNVSRWFLKESLAQGCRHTGLTELGRGSSWEKSSSGADRAGEGAWQGCGPSWTRLPLHPQEAPECGAHHSVGPTWRPGAGFAGCLGRGRQGGLTSMGVTLCKTWAIGSQYSQPLGTGVPSTGVWAGL